jgi:hypothetical protein
MSLSGQEVFCPPDLSDLSRQFNSRRDTAHPMASEDLKPSDHDQLDPASAEVQFALVIARMIDSVRNNPADMRQAIYDLARYKLQEQFTYADAANIGRTEQALENAIRGVEAFSKQHVSIPAMASPLPGNASDIAAPAPHQIAPPAFLRVRTRPHMQIDSKANSGSSEERHVRWPRLARVIAIIAVLVGALVIVQQRDHLAALTGNLPSAERQAVSEQPRLPPQATNYPAPPPPPAKPAALQPTDYGVYAVSNDSLAELQLLPGRPPDIRVAVSAALKVPSRTFLTNGHPKFIVFRRDAAMNASDRAEVRVIAKVAREFSGEVAGKKPSDGDDTWVIRNVSFPFRSSPVKDNPEMYELHSEDPGLELTPGRYALVLKNQSYDFSVEGKPTDAKQCIERIVTTNGTFYSDCKTP